MPLRSMAGTSLQLTRMEVELSAVALSSVGDPEGTEEWKVTTSYVIMIIVELFLLK